MRRERELDKELRFHLDHQIEENLRAGMSPSEARRQAILTFGGPTQIREECREQRPLFWLGTLWADVRYAVRTLRASPAFSLSAVVSIALGIGANAAIYTLLHAALWKPLQVPRPSELFQAIRSDGVDQTWSYSWPLYQELRDAVAPYGTAFARGSAEPRRFSMGGMEPERVIGEAVTSEYFSALEVSPFAGRFIDHRDEETRQSVAVVSHEFWTTRLRGDLSVLGRIIQYQEMPFQIIGVAQPGFNGIDAGMATGIWVPTAVVDSRFVTDGISSNWLTLMVRAQDGKAAQAAIETRFQRHVMEEELPRARGKRSQQSLMTQHIRLRPAASGLASLGRPYERALLVLMGVVGLVLLISCANVANLMLARNLSRWREIAVRLALGAGRARLASQLLTESVVLALVGAAVGLLLGIAGCRLLLGLLPAQRVPLEFDLRPDAAVLVFTALAAIGTALLCGAGPAWRAWRSGANGPRHDGVRITDRTLGRKLLVIGQLALSLVLISGAGLFLKTLHSLAITDLGFRPERVMAFEISFPRASSKQHQARTNSEMLERLSSRSGFRATYASPGVYENGAWSRVMRAVDGRRLPAGMDTEVQMLGVGPAFFEMLGIGVRSGRAPDEHDGPNSPPVVVVNETFARRYFADTSPLGHSLEPLREGKAPPEIVGVVRDVKHMGVKERARPVVYVPALQMDGLEGTLLVRSGLRPAQLESAVRTELKQVDPSARVEYSSTLESAVNSMISRERLIAYLSAAFGGLAMLLAAVGLYGVIAYAMSRRTGEIGIRMALGARPSDIRWLGLSESLRLICAGVLAGVPAALAGATLVHGLLYGIRGTDPWVLGGASLVLVIVALVAGWLPASRAARIDPNSALRQC